MRLKIIATLAALAASTALLASAAPAGALSSSNAISSSAAPAASGLVESVAYGRCVRWRDVCAHRWGWGWRFRRCMRNHAC